ncbi:MAG: hypothetical protein R3E53_09080 [Myxococcota bacterium]
MEQAIAEALVHARHDVRVAGHVDEHGAARVLDRADPVVAHDLVVAAEAAYEGLVARGGQADHAHAFAP